MMMTFEYSYEELVRMKNLAKEKKDDLLMTMDDKELVR